MDMTVTRAQSDMRRGYCSGAAGVLASSLAWSAAAAAAVVASPQRAMWVLLIGGALIHPVAVLLCRLLGAPGRHDPRNPLGPLAASSTLWLIFCMPITYGLGLQTPAWFFAAMLLVIGGRFLVFATLYGLRLYWALGLVLAAAGVASGWLHWPAPAIALAGAVTEMSFAMAAIVLHRRWIRSGDEVEPAPLHRAA